MPRFVEKHWTVFWLWLGIAWGSRHQRQREPSHTNMSPLPLGTGYGKDIIIIKAYVNLPVDVPQDYVRVDGVLC